MHNYIENRRVNNVYKSFGFFSVFILLLIGVSKISPSFYNQEQQNIFNSLNDRDVYRCGKLIRILDPAAISCKLNSEEFNNSALLLGNSHADAIKLVFSSVMSKHKYNTYFFVNNDPMIGNTLPPKKIIEEAINKKISWIFVHYKSGTLEINKLNELVMMSKKNNIRVTLILPVPIYENNSYYEGSIPKSLFLGKDSKLSYKDYLLINQNLMIKAKDLKSSFSNFEYLNTSQVFCSSVCSISTLDKKPYYFDDDHLTITGARKLEPVFESIFLK